MSAITDGSSQIIFHHKRDVLDYLLKNILDNKNRKIGTEWEMFLVDRAGHAISLENGQKAFHEFQRFFRFRGYQTNFMHETLDGKRTICGLNIHNLGVITPEIGHQFEFACSVCNNAEELEEKNTEFLEAVTHVADTLNHTTAFKGHDPLFAATSQGSYRSRSQEWHRYFDARFNTASKGVCEALDATASTQISIDSGSEKFHEFFQALLLIEPALTLHYANSSRPHIGVVRLPSSHIKPIVSVWKTKTPEEATGAIVDRLMQVDVPFLPNPFNPEVYRAEPLRGGCPSTVEDLMMQGQLSEKALNNIGGFLLSRPAIRRFSQGLIEVRGIDSQETPAKITEIAQRIEALIYNDKNREKLLSDYEHLDNRDIFLLHQISALSNVKMALQAEVANKNVLEFIEDILDRSSPPPKALMTGSHHENLHDNSPLLQEQIKAVS